jgi:hypothetical protein
VTNVPSGLTATTRWVTTVTAHAQDEDHARLDLRGSRCDEDEVAPGDRRGHRAALDRDEAVPGGAGDPAVDEGEHGEDGDEGQAEADAQEPPGTRVARRRRGRVLGGDNRPAHEAPQDLSTVHRL